MFKNKFGPKNKVVDALSHIRCLLRTMRVEVLEFDRLKIPYSSYPDVGLVHWELLDGNHRPYVDFIFQDGYLFRDSQLYIPRTSFKDFLV